VSIAYLAGGRWLEAVREVDLQVEAGQTYGLVGESGSGKSTLALAILRYLPPNGAIRHGSIRFDGRDLYALTPSEMQALWAQEIKLVPQNALSSLNPSLRIGDQLAEGLEQAGTRDARAHVPELLRMVRLPDPERVAASYPHQLSGGMQQRVMIALALCAEPQLLVLDEPTTSLDVTTEAAILDLVGELIAQRNTSVLFVSHNLGIVARICDRVAVLYAGELVEDGAVDDLYRQPLHPYTQGLLDSAPRLGQTKHSHTLQSIPGSIPRLNDLPPGCIFAPRCPIALDRCHRERPALDEPQAGRKARCHRWPEILSGAVDVRAAYQALQTVPDAPAAAVIHASGAKLGDKPALQLGDVAKWFPLARSLLDVVQGKPSRQVRAVDGVSLQIERGQTLGLVGESGSGKTTLARCIVGLAEASEGEIRLLDIPLARSLNQRDRETLHHLQMVFQNPDEALNPYHTVAETLGRPLMRLGGCTHAEVGERIDRLLDMVKLRREYAGRLPAQLSGGEKQRVAIARAFASSPDLLLFDEPVSALDVSVQASILNLLNELQRQQGSAYLFITHDLGAVSYLADEIAVVYLGRLMEVGKMEDFFIPPYHPYTEALLSAVPVADPGAQRPRIRLDGEAPSPIDMPTGCPFHTRCPRCLGELCMTETPPWRDGPNGQRIFCHIPLDELEAAQTRLAR
jgi:peptide/nickel transport system ATP-binding protein